MLDIHRLYCQRFLHQLEEIQQNLPKVQQYETAYELELLFDSFNRECQQNLTRLIKQKDDEEQFQLFKQLEIICDHIQKLTPHLTQMKKNHLTSEQVNNYFDDQERFINIVQKHLYDLNNILYSTPN